MRDELSPTIEKALSGDAIICGSPIYLGDVSSLTRAFIERIGFSSVSYDRGHNSTFSGKINCAFFYTMNVPRPIHLFYHYVYLLNTGNLRRFNGKVQQLVSTDTWQFDDYSKYNASMFNEDKKRKRRETQFPKDCKKAFEIGRGIV
jgi:multimeric flavodoxin WrbA